MPLLHTMSLVHLLFRKIDNLIYPISYIVQTLFSASQALYPSFILCTTSHFTTYIRSVMIHRQLRPQVLTTIHFLKRLAIYGARLKRLA